MWILKNTIALILLFFLTIWFVSAAPTGISWMLTDIRSPDAWLPTVVSNQKWTIWSILGTIFNSDWRITHDYIEAFENLSNWRITRWNTATDKYENTYITSADITNWTVTWADIAANTITAADIATSGVWTAEILDGTVTWTDIANSTITWTDIAANTITAADIATSGVWTAEILDGTITWTDIASNAITSVKIANSTITSADILNSTITSADILDWTITSADLAATALIWQKNGSEIYYNNNIWVWTITNPAQSIHTSWNIRADGRIYVDNGTNYLSYPTWNYGSTQINGAGKWSWMWFSVGWSTVFMANWTAAGLYNDTNNEWLFYWVHNWETRMYHNWARRIRTHASWVQFNWATQLDNVTCIWNCF